MARPGLGWIGRTTLSILSLGSEFVRDAPYSSAALDPTPLSSLVIFVAFISPLPLLLAMGVGGIEFVVPWIEKKIDREIDEAADSEEASERLRRSVRRSEHRSRIISVIMIVVLLLTFGVSYVSAGVVNQAVFVWRVFHANLRILEPHMSDDERDGYSASFAAMRFKTDYLKIAEGLQGIADENGVELRPEKTW